MSEDYTHEYDTAVKKFEDPAQCNECYVWYDNEIQHKCPICGSTNNI